MTSVSKRTVGFTSASVYRRREPHAFRYLSERATFWIAVLSVFAFVTGNMVGQHGWHVFWKSVLGEGSDAMIVFTGTVPPVAQVPDYEKWGRLGGDVHTHTFRQVPKDLLVPLPRYVHHGQNLSADALLRRVYFVEHLGTYENGRGKGSHAGVDISMPEGTPIQSIASGIVDRVDDDAGGFGTFVVVRHPNVPDVERLGEKSTIYSVYAHLSSALVHEGMVVQKGDVIALSGSSGLATAPHLHFQIDRSDAPYHPYWLFSGAEQREAGLSFTQAIDRGLHRERGVQYTMDPMLTVQAYATFTGTVVADASSVSSAKRPMTVADRRQARLSRIAARRTLVAFNDAAPSQAAEPSALSSSSVSASAMSAGVGTVTNVRIGHGGSFTRERGWKTITLTLLDASGRVVTVPAENRKLYLSTAFGHAEFKNATVNLTDFTKGVFETQMRPLADQTVVIEEKTYKVLSAPMKFVR